MPFPPTDRVIYEKNPIQEVICQLRFPTVLAIGASAPAAYQDKIRRDYPMYSQEQTSLPKELSEIIAKLPVPKLGGGLVHRFLTADSKRYIALAPDSIALSESDYKRWEILRREIERAKLALEEIYSPAFYTRIGLRYRDVIDKEAIGLGAIHWHDLFRDTLIGLLGDPVIGTQVDGIQTQVSIRLDEVPGAQATIRHGLIRAQQTGKEVYVIDTDWFINERKESNEVIVLLDQFNRTLGNFFRWAISPQLRDALHPTELVPVK